MQRWTLNKRITSPKRFYKAGVEPKNVAREIREACSDLLNRVVTIDTPIGNLSFHWLHNVLHFKSETFEQLKNNIPMQKMMKNL